jgi:hypothetical protein
MDASSKEYQLEKSLWTEKDFDTMGWHDSFVYGISFGENFQLLFDIDYIFKWVLTGEIQTGVIFKNKKAIYKIMNDQMKCTLIRNLYDRP